VKIPDPRYVRTEDGVYIAYQVVGEGSVDISLQHAWLGGLELMWEDPYVSAFYEQLAIRPAPRERSPPEENRWEVR
jgi:hypothetical protein